MVGSLHQTLWNLLALALVVHGEFTCHTNRYGHIELSWGKCAQDNCDVYELHLHSSETDSAFAAAFTYNEESITLTDVLPGHTYYIKKRTHLSGQTLDHGWSTFTSRIKCTVPASSELNSQLNATGDLVHSVSTFAQEVVREARGKSPDYLGEHNAANYLGEASFLAKHAHATSQLELFCVDIMSQTVFGTSTTGGDHRFANYASCNKKPSDPSVYEPYKCTTILDADCKWLKLTDAECSAARSKDSWERSSKYVGMGRSNTKHISLFSFPKATQCWGKGGVGTKRTDGTTCTWKVRSHFRLALGNLGMSWESIQKALEDAPLKKWHCSGSTHIRSHGPDEITLV